MLGAGGTKNWTAARGRELSAAALKIVKSLTRQISCDYLQVGLAQNV